MAKKIITVVLIAALSMALFACGEKTYIKTAGGNYEVTAVQTDDTFDDAAAPAGKEYLLIQMEGQSANMDDMQDAFFGVEKERVTVQTSEGAVPCQLIRYAAASEGEKPDVKATLVFEVPTGFAGEFTLSGDAFSPVALEAKKSVF